jgi:hypothetical protein
MIGHWYASEIAVHDRRTRFVAEAERDAATREVDVRRPSLVARLFRRAPRRPAPTPVAVPAGTAPVGAATTP